MPASSSAAKIELSITASPARVTISGSGATTCVDNCSPKTTSIRTPSSTASETVRGLPSMVEATVTECPGRSRRRSYSAPSARATSALSGAASPASDSKKSSVSPGATSRDHVDSGGSIARTGLSATATCRRGSGLRLCASSAHAVTGSVTGMSTFWGTSGRWGIQLPAWTSSGGTGSFDKRSKMAIAAPETVPAIATQAAKVLSLMSPPPFLLPARGEFSAPRILWVRDSRSW